MPDRRPIPLEAIPIRPDGPEFREILGWPFEDRFVHRLLAGDIPRRTFFGQGRSWAYREPGGPLAGFGSLDVCDEYGAFSGGRPHLYLPLLAVNPSIQGRGYGTAILQHLIAGAATLARDRDCHEFLYLDVYTTSPRAIALYRKLGFIELTDSPIPDPLEGGKTYLIMAKRVGATALDP